MMKPWSCVVVVCLSFSLLGGNFCRGHPYDRAPRALFDNLPFVSDVANLAGNVAGRVSSGISGAVQGIGHDVEDVASKVSSGVGKAIDTFVHHPDDTSVKPEESTTVDTVRLRNINASSAAATDVPSDNQQTTAATEMTSTPAPSNQTELASKANIDKPEVTTKENSAEAEPKNLFDLFGSVITNPIEAIETGISNPVKALETGIGSAVNTVKSGIDSGVGAVGKAIHLGTSSVGKGIDMVKSGIENTVGAVESGVGNAVQLGTSGIGNVVGGIRSGIGNVVGSVESGVGGAVDAVMPKPPQETPPPEPQEHSWFDNVVGFFVGIRDKFGQLFSNVGDLLSNLAVFFQHLFAG